MILRHSSNKNYFLVPDSHLFMTSSYSMYSNGEHGQLSVLAVRSGSLYLAWLICDVAGPGGGAARAAAGVDAVFSLQGGLPYVAGPRGGQGPRICLKQT